MSRFPVIPTMHTAGFVIFVTTWLVPVPSLAAEPENNGRRILQSCEAAVEYLDNANAAGKDDAVRFCNDYITGFREDENVKDLVMGEKHIRGYCLPYRGVTNADLARVIVHYLKSNEQEQILDANTAVRYALADGYPCN